MKLRIRGFQINSSYLTTLKCCMSCNHMHLRDLHRLTARETDWQCYSTELQAALQGIIIEIIDTDTLERAADLFLSAIITMCEYNCLPSEVKKTWETHWCNIKLEKFRKESRERFRRAKKSNTEELWNLSNAFRIPYRKTIRESKSKTWTSFCSDI